MQDISVFFNHIDKCPICSSTDYVIESRNIYNRYSEEVARLLNTTEDKLIDSMVNLRCLNCNVGYKNIWFKQDVYYKVFIEASPFHPQGWDSLTTSFTPEEFIENVNLLKKHIANKDKSNINKYKRTILAYINNITTEYVDKFHIKNLIEIALDLDYQTLNEKSYCFLVEEVSPHIVEAREFGRFTGYRSRLIKQFFEKNVKTLDSYGEIGSPLWGMFDIYKRESNKALYFFRDEDKTFWGEKDIKDGVFSYEYAEKNYNVNVTSLSLFSKLNKKLDLINMIHYLDHNADPVNLLKRLSKVTKYLMIINHIDTPSLRCIQHFTNFNNTVFEYLADELNFEIVDTFQENNNVLHGILIKFL